MEYYTATIAKPGILSVKSHNKIESQQYFELKKPNTELNMLYYFI